MDPLSNRRDTGISTSSIVFSPTSALPRSLMASTPAANAWATSLRPGNAASPMDFPIAMKKLEIKGPEAPPIVDNSFMPMALSAELGDLDSSSARIAISTSQPRRTLR